MFGTVLRAAGDTKTPMRVGLAVNGINMALNFVLEFLYDRFFVFRDSLDTNSIAKKKQARDQK